MAWDFVLFRPERIAIALVGDGAMQMLDINALLAVSRYWPRWQDPRLVVLVLNNDDVNQVTWEQRVLSEDPKYPASPDVPPFNCAAYAEAIGFKGLRVEHPDEVGPAWDAAFRAHRPCVIDAVTNPNVPPLPPHIKVEQAKGCAQAMLKGNPDALKIMWQSVKKGVQGVLPGT